MASDELIYLDFNATTPVHPAVLEAMLPWFSDCFWNPASNHGGGRVANDTVAVARGRVASLIGARPSEIVWTSGATEANNLALKGVVEAAPVDRRGVVTVATEHKAVLDTVEWLAGQGVRVTVLPVADDGSISLEHLHGALASGDTAVVSIMAANNETGVIADLAAIAAVVHEHGALLHSDATQAVGRVPFDVQSLGVDLASMSAHKLYGPKGVGALFVSRQVELAPTIHGGGHERGLRSGTLNAAGIVGFGAAAELTSTDLQKEAERQRELLDHLLELLRTTTDDLEVVAPEAVRLPGTANIRATGADAEAVMANAPTVAVSSGSACTSLVPAPSHVLRAMGYSNEAALECLRISVGRPTTEQDVEEAARLLSSAIARVRSYTG
jgi:cysteine desulfurase